MIPSGSKRRGAAALVLNTGIGSRSAPADSTLHPEERKRFNINFKNTTIYLKLNYYFNI